MLEKYSTVQVEGVHSWSKPLHALPTQQALAMVLTAHCLVQVFRVTWNSEIDSTGHIVGMRVWTTTNQYCGIIFTGHTHVTFAAVLACHTPPNNDIHSPCILVTQDSSVHRCSTLALTTDTGVSRGLKPRGAAITGHCCQD